MAETNTENDEQFDRIVHQYYQAVEAGETVQPEAFIRQHSEHENELRSFFADLHALDDLPGLGAMERTTDPSVSRSSHASVPSVSAGDRITYIGQYRLLEEIARGGMGVVFKARQTNLNRIVALKMILAGQFAGEEDVQRFYTEAEAAAQLDHPGIVPIFEIRCPRLRCFSNRCQLQRPSCDCQHRQFHRHLELAQGRKDWGIERALRLRGRHRLFSRWIATGLCERR